MAFPVTTISSCLMLLMVLLIERTCAHCTVTLASGPMVVGTIITSMTFVYVRRRMLYVDFTQIALWLSSDTGNQSNLNLIYRFSALCVLLSHLKGGWQLRSLPVLKCTGHKTHGTDSVTTIIVAASMKWNTLVYCMGTTWSTQDDALVGHGRTMVRLSEFHRSVIGGSRQS